MTTLKNEYWFQSNSVLTNSLFKKLTFKTNEIILNIWSQLMSYYIDFHSYNKYYNEVAKSHNRVCSVDLTILHLTKTSQLNDQVYQII